MVSVEDKMKEYRARWLEHLQAMNDTKRLYTPRERNDLDRPKKRWESNWNRKCSYALKWKWWW